MEKSTKIILGIGIGASLLAIYLMSKNKETNADGSGDTLPTYLPPAIPDGVPEKTKKGFSYTPDPKIKKFQDWMDINHPRWVKATNSALSNGKSLNKGGGYGNFGSSTKAAMARYGAEYNSKATPSKVTAPVVAVPAIKSPKRGAKLYTKNTGVKFYSYPDGLDSSVVMAQPKQIDRIALFDYASPVKGWWKVQAYNKKTEKVEGFFIKADSVSTFHV